VPPSLRKWLPPLLPALHRNCRPPPHPNRLPSPNLLTDPILRPKRTPPPPSNSPHLRQQRLHHGT
ncbi:hypothetical protein BBP40_012275, partial [Aspergillus hancockii]